MNEDRGFMFCGVEVTSFLFLVLPGLFRCCRPVLLGGEPDLLFSYFYFWSHKLDGYTNPNMCKHEATQLVWDVCDCTNQDKIKACDLTHVFLASLHQP